MNHEELLTDYLDGRLDAAGRREAEALLAADPALARRLRLLRAVRGALRAEAAPAPAALKARLRAAAAERASRPGWRDMVREAFSPRPWSWGAATACAAVLAAVLVRKDKAPAAAPAPLLIEAAAPAAPAPEWDRARGELSQLWADDDGGDHEDA